MQPRPLFNFVIRCSNTSRIRMCVYIIRKKIEKTCFSEIILYLNKEFKLDYN